MLHDQLLRLHTLHGGCLFEPLEQAAIHQKARLRAVAQHTHVGLLRRQCNAGEIDMGRDVLQADIGQRIGVGLVRAVAHHRAHVALRVVVLRFRKTVVDKEQRAGAEFVAQRAHKGLRLRVDLGQEIVLALRRQGWPQIGRHIAPDKAGRCRVGLRQCHTALMPDTLGACQQFDRHRIEHLVANHHALQRVRQFADPAHEIGILLQRLLLAGAQATREIDDGVARERLPHCGQCTQHLQRQRAGAGAELPDFRGLRHLQCLCHLGGQGLAKQRRHLRCRDEVAARRGRVALRGIGQAAEFGTVVGVITQARRVQRQRHEFVKADPAATPGDGLRNMARQSAR